MRGSNKSVTVGLPHWRLKLDVDSSRFMGHWEDPELPEMARNGHLGQPWACPLCGVPATPVPLLRVTQRDLRLPSFHCAHHPSRVH